MIRKTLAGFAGAATILASTPALAEEAGAVNLTIDGETYAFPLWASQSDWSGSEQWASVNIYARPLDEETWASFKTFTLGLQVISGEAMNYEISLTTADGDALTGYFGEADETPGSVTVEDISVDGAFLTVTGAFTVTMGTSENWGRDIDLTAPLVATGAFNVTLGPVE